ncbi:hypothetical protein [Bacteroides sp.]|uniref:hypothetical protein n=1 Tax=Bacteroides sp. TaxID=29523 RepID=UPI002629BA48|nr:hypothetical protein [Bacteroides sp.]MDD3039938.1 hypothetical protein [Bacteroides sp.]
METVIVTTEAVIEKIMERVLDKKLPQSPEASVEKTYWKQIFIFNANFAISG